MVTFRFHELPCLSLRVEFVDIVRSVVVEKETAYQKDVTFCADQSVFLARTWMDLAFGRDLDPVEGLLRVLERDRIKILETSL